MSRKWIKYIIGAIVLVGMIALTPITYGQDNPSITSFSEAIAVAQSKGEKIKETTWIPGPEGEMIEIKLDCYIYKLGGIGECGWWTFYTIKHYPAFKSTVIVIYKPEFGSVIILRKDYNAISNVYFYTIIFEINHSTVIDVHMIMNDTVGDGFVDLFVRPIQSLQVDSPWEFNPTDEMRHGDCWQIKPKEGAK